MVMDDTSEESKRVQTEIYRQMPLTIKARLIFDAYHTGQKLAFAGLRLRHPDASSKKIWYLWARQHLGKELFKEVYGEVPDD